MGIPLSYSRVSTIVWLHYLEKKSFMGSIQRCCVLLHGHLRSISETSRHDKQEMLDTNREQSRAILNKSWRQHPTRHQLYGHLPPITKTIQVKRTRHAGHCWRSRDQLISDVLLWTPTYGRAKQDDQHEHTFSNYMRDTGCSSEDLPEAMNDREKWRERG